MGRILLVVVAMVLLAALLLIGCGVPQEEHDAVVTERDVALSQVASLQSDLTEAQDEINNLERDLTVIESELAKVNEERDKLMSDLAAAESNLKATQNDLTDTRNSLAQVRKELAIPDAPVLLSPPSLSVFDNFPRTTVLEWNPSYGSKPITYVIEVEYTWNGVYIAFGRWQEGDYGFAMVGKTTDTVFTFEFVGAQPGRWRVKATNSYGESNWSEWRYFRYTR